MQSGGSAKGALCCVDSMAAHDKAQRLCTGGTINSDTCTLLHHCSGMSWEKSAHQLVAAVHAAEPGGDA